jgi:hypothetical protein
VLGLGLSKANSFLAIYIRRPADMDMPFGYPQISIPGPAHYGGGLEQELED